MFPKRGAVALVTTVLGLVLLFSFKTPEPAAVGAVVQADPTTGSSGTTSSGATTGSSGTTSSGATTGSTATATPAPTATAGTAASTGTATITGTTVSTRFGDVAVQVTVANGSITAVQAVSLPSGGRSGEISAYAEPILASEALTAQSASIDVVSGATYTSRAYAQSLQAALDQAGIATTTANG